ncbi:tetratricopeptide repeat protein [Aliarcobacter butzleri]|uniref:tetratricopeptide repeat protein n=1 Tax=Aliarcobacter butzleri TaxID=28197 RepID=UPI003AFA1FC5
MKKDFLITFSILFFLLLIGSIFWKENNIISIVILILLSIFLILSSIGPKSLLNFIFEYTQNGTKLSFNRHIATEEEIKFALNSEDFKISELENQEIYEKSINRGFKERSDVDFLIISTKLWRENKNEEALEQAYFGLYISKDKSIKSLLTMRIGTIFENIKEYKIQKEKYDKALAIDPKNTKALNNLSIYYIKQKMFSRAKELILESLNLNEENFNTYNILGILYSDEMFKEHDYEKAKKYLLKALELTTTNKPLINLGDLYSNEKFQEYDYKKAEEYLLKALDKEDEKKTIILINNYIGRMYLKEHDYKKAEKYFLEALNIDKTDSEVLKSLGMLYSNKNFKEHDYKKAEKYYLETLRNDSKNEELLNDIGYFYLELNQLDKAKDYFLEAYYNKKDAPYINDSLGEVYMELEDFELSEKYFKQAIELDNQDIVFYENLIKLYDKFNKKEKKLEIEKALEKIKKEKNSNSNSSSQEPQ